MVLCLDQCEADLVNLALSVRRARARPSGNGTILPKRTDEGLIQYRNPDRQSAASRWNKRPVEAAKFFSVTETELAKWRKAGLGPFYRQSDNGSVLYRLDELAGWLGDGFHDGGESWELLLAAGSVSASPSACKDDLSQALV